MSNKTLKIMLAILILFVFGLILNNNMALAWQDDLENSKIQADIGDSINQDNLLKSAPSEVNDNKSDVATIKVTGTYYNDMAKEVLRLINIERISRGIKPLVMDKDFFEAAKQRAAETAVFFDHTRPDSTSCFDIFPKKASTYSFGENIAKGQKSAKEVVDTWMNSSGHRANILNSSYTVIGIACFYTPSWFDYGYPFNYHWVQCFGSAGTEMNNYPSNENKQVLIDIVPLSVDYNFETTSIKINAGEDWSEVRLQAIHRSASSYFYGFFCDTSSFEFRSQNENIATGRDGRIYGNRPGKTVIEIIDTAGNLLHKINVEVTDKDASIKLQETTKTMVIGDTYKLKAIITSKFDTNQQINWSSSNKSVATVDTNGNITAKAKGSAVIKAQLANGKYAQCTLKVIEPIKLVSINIYEENLEVEINKPYKLNLIYNPKNTTDDKTATWSSSNTSIAKVDNNGVITGLKSGTATITAKVGNKTDTCKVEVIKEKIGIYYHSHVQGIGWEGEYSKGNGQTTGILGLGKKVEAIKIQLKGLDKNAHIKYQTHVQGIGWMDYVSDGAQSGTTGMNKKIEAIRIKLEGLPGYSVEYRAYVTDYGWLNWVSDGITSGTTGQNRKLEALQIRLVKTEAKEPIVPGVTYRGHVQKYGWMNYVFDEETVGVLGEGRKIEAFRLMLTNVDENAHIKYQTHVQGIGWMDYVQDNAISGTTGMNKKVEAIRIKLEGLPGYSVEYRAYVADYGWLDWVSDGVTSGTTGQNRKLEALQIRIVKTEEKVPVEPGITYRGHVQNIGWMNYVFGGETCGVEGKGLKVEAFRIMLTNVDENAHIKYQTHVQGIGWMDYVQDNAISGTTGKNKKIEAIRIKLEGLEGYSVEYRAFVNGEGWQDWVSDGEEAGTTGKNLKLEAIQIRIVKK